MKSEIEILKFQYYSGNIRNTTAQGFYTLSQFIAMHQNPTPKMLLAFDAIEQATIAGHKERKSKLKEDYIPYFTVGAIFQGGRKYANIDYFTGLAQIDIDGLEPEEAEDLKEYLFFNYEHLYCAYLSPSRCGVKAIIRIPVVNTVKEYKEIYQGIQNELDWLPGFDTAPKNLALPLFLSYDKDILYRESAKIWHKRGEIQDLNNTPNLESVPTRILNGDETVFRSTGYYRKISLDIFTKKIEDIIDNGHPQLRSACLVLGSRVGAGYLSKHEAEGYAEALIRGSQYLSKGIANYITTMKWAISRGMTNPKYYKED